MCDLNFKDKFEVEKYVHMKNVLSKNDCDELVIQLKELVQACK